MRKQCMANSSHWRPARSKCSLPWCCSSRKFVALPSDCRMVCRQSLRRCETNEGYSSSNTWKKRRNNGTKSSSSPSLKSAKFNLQVLPEASKRRYRQSEMPRRQLWRRQKPSRLQLQRRWPRRRRAYGTKKQHRRWRLPRVKRRRRRQQKPKRSRHHHKSNRTNQAMTMSQRGWEKGRKGRSRVLQRRRMILTQLAQPRLRNNGKQKGM
mmetsp:Transcript_37744/g.87207  ORF Transcript_37744/g.87207 Transcript_37744/m.87207 type:complete len:209 (-) Transcript_37744:2299-2925(-)